MTTAVFSFTASEIVEAWYQHTLLATSSWTKVEVGTTEKKKGLLKMDLRKRGPELRLRGRLIMMGSLQGRIRKSVAWKLENIIRKTGKLNGVA